MELARESGAYLGEIASDSLVRPGGVWARKLVDRLLASRPIEGALADDAAYRAFVESVVAGAKEMALWGKIGPEAADAFAGWMDQCWSALRGASTNQDQPSRFTLFVFQLLSPVHPRAAPDSRPADPRTWWAALERLTCRIVDEGSPADIFPLVFELRESNVLRCLRAGSLRTFIDHLAARVDGEPPGVLHANSDVMESWPWILIYASEVLEAVALADDADARLHETISRILEKWANPPLSLDRAVRAARRLRTGS
ncbi:hypothetical protein BE21_51520 [Sorangium cellulosum]|uniref:Uncharacterized protein n=1 Tax=Sorangium cellulosum TaxID=56 RepID=A0A150TG31_SORCE|nr:hypothetical protein BE21_51520 [Sorangium cellulosum]